MEKSIRILGISGSLRQASRNTALLRYAKNVLPQGHFMEIADITQIPLYNQDQPNPTPAVQQLFNQIKQADALLLACPEYNYSIAPALKNALDWASREKDNYLLNGKAAAILGAGGGMGTSRAQYHLRQVAVYLNLHMVNKPEVFCNAFAPNTFSEQGELISEPVQQNIQQQLQTLINLAQQRV
jgi:chromate reductase